MTREDIERMARAAKGHPYTNKYAPGETAFAFSIDRLEHFVEMVTAAEREACAKVAETNGADEPYGHAKFRCHNIADEIRARGQQ